MIGITSGKRKKLERNKRKKALLDQVSQENDENMPIHRKRMSTSGSVTENTADGIRRTDRMHGVIEDFKRRKTSRKIKSK